MALQFYGDGKFGEVWIEDRRTDGSVVMLVCTPAVTRSQSGRNRQSPGQDEPQFHLVESSAADGSAYPHLRERGLVHQRMAPIHVETSSLPGGIQRFVTALFARKAMTAAAQGIREVTLTTATAHEWGWQPDDDQSDVEDYPVPGDGPARRRRAGSED